MDELTQARTRLNELLDDAIERDALAALDAVVDIEDDLVDHRSKAVRAAAATHTWAEIGDALGVSRQAAHRKFAKEWAHTVTTEVKAEHRAFKDALRSGDRAAARKAKRSRDALIEEVKSAGRGRRKRR